MKAYAKANIFLKILGINARGYHLLSSRFILVKELYDELFFVGKTKENKPFELVSNFECKENILFKAYELLASFGFRNELEDFFKTKAVKLVKNIPQGGGLGGGSSNAACFIKMLNEELHLKLDLQSLFKIGQKIGADVNFFLSSYESANVSGIGEKVVEIEDEPVSLEFVFPNLVCETARVYKAYDEMKIDYTKALSLALDFEKTSSKNLLLERKNTELNDLFTPCINLYPKMLAFLEQDFFLSGSGSTVFKVI